MEPTPLRASPLVLEASFTARREREVISHVALAAVAVRFTAFGH